MEDSADEEEASRLAVLKLADLPLLLPAVAARSCVAVGREGAGGAAGGAGGGAGGGGVLKVRRAIQTEMQTCETYRRFAYLDELRAQRSPLLALAYDSVSVGTQVKQQEQDFVVRYYQLASDEASIQGTHHGACPEASVGSLFVADCFADGARAVRAVFERGKAHGGGGGPLLVFLAPGESADKKNMDVVRAISANSVFIDENNWGVIPLAPTRAVRSNEVVELEEEAPRGGAQYSSTTGPLEQGVSATTEPNHADFQALKHNVTSLPALVLTTASGDSRLGNVMDGRALTQLCRNGGVGLYEWLVRYKREAGALLERERQEKGNYELAHKLHSVFLARSSAAMIQGLGFRLVCMFITAVPITKLLLVQIFFTDMFFTDMSQNDVGQGSALSCCIGHCCHKQQLKFMK